MSFLCFFVLHDVLLVILAAAFYVRVLIEVCFCYRGEEQLQNMSNVFSDIRI